MSDCHDESCNCGLQLPRRTFLKMAGAVPITAIFGKFAGPFCLSDFEQFEVPIDKKLSPEWIKSLYARGKPTVYRGKALENIGMPVGGICAGMLYLGGDGKLWHWDIFNQNKFGISPSVNYQGRTLNPADGASYVQPIHPGKEVVQGFWLLIDGKKFPLEAGGWDDISFQGQYPTAVIKYSDPKTKVTVRLTAFSPFIPLNEEESGLPVTVMRYIIKNDEDHPVEIELGSFLENPIGKFSSHDAELKRQAERFEARELTGLHFTAAPAAPAEAPRPDLLVEDWNSKTYQGWKSEGNAFGTGPVDRSQVPAYQGDLGGTGDHVVNTHAGAPGTTVEARDSAVGKLTGPSFKIERKCLNFWIGGGNHPNGTCLNLIQNGKVVRTATGADNNRMHLASFPVEDLQGSEVHLEIVDSVTGAWGNIGIGRIWQSDREATEIPLTKRHDFGTMALAIFDKAESLPGGQVSIKRTIEPGRDLEATFAVAWHFPNVSLGLADDKSGPYYAKRFANAKEVIRYLHKNETRLVRETLEWNSTWYDSTLPFWFLDRTFANASTLATTTCHRFGTGRFYAWEGIGCCAGTCTHVWHYAQAVGRLFPALERDLRERVDYGVGFHPDTGAIGFRAEFYNAPAVDGQAGSILRTLREHQMSANSDFLLRVWLKAKKATEFLIGLDAAKEGILQGPQDNTLDAAWFGKIAWTSSLYNAALRAAAEMAAEAKDPEFKKQCLALADRGKESIQTQLFNGEYFIQLHDQKNPGALGTYNACHVDQVMGQSWAHQVGLPRVLDKDKTLSALTALYKYNFTPDVGPFRKAHGEGRWYAMPGEGGMVMVTNPKAEKNPYGDTKAWQFGYFNECMSGFEHQVASHMIAEGLVQEGLTVTKAIHERYDGARRNPYNEIECSDHYARAMASYGSFISICGFQYHGPSGALSFAPKITPEDFRAPFVTAEGWGTYSQRVKEKSFDASLNLRYGRLTLKKLSLQIHLAGVVVVKLGTKVISTKSERADGFSHIVFPVPIVLHKGDKLFVAIQAP